jgi:hypothetical protein
VEQELARIARLSHGVVTRGELLESGISRDAIRRRVLRGVLYPVYHQSRHAWEQDRRREREAHARGDDFRRYTYGDVFEAPEQMLAELRALLLAA